MFSLPKSPVKSMVFEWFRHVFPWFLRESSTFLKKPNGFGKSIPKLVYTHPVSLPGRLIQRVQLANERGSAWISYRGAGRRPQVIHVSPHASSTFLHWGRIYDVMGPMTHAAPTCMYEIVIFEFPSTSITFPLEKGSGLNRAARSVTVASRPLEVLRISHIVSRSDELNS